MNDPGRLDQPSAARMYDYFLGGAHNFAVDREAAARILELYPAVSLAAQANRDFLRRAVRYQLGQGIDQFLDLGSGIPTVGNVHEVVAAVRAGVHVVYVDNDPIAVAHSEALLAGVPGVEIVQADVRDPAAVLAAPAVRDLIDFDRPVGLLAVAVMHFVSGDDDPYEVLGHFRAALAPGSHLAFSHGTVEVQPEAAAASAEVYSSTRDPLTLRTRAQISTLLDGWDLVEPGLVWLPEWRPDWPDSADEDPSWTEILCAVGVKASG